jgi:hypothetical protein
MKRDFKIANYHSGPAVRSLNRGPARRLLRTPLRHRTQRIEAYPRVTRGPLLKAWVHRLTFRTRRCIISTASVVAALTAVAAFAHAQSQSQFSCGPYLTTYTVSDAYNHVVAVHCLKYTSDTNISASRTIAWYGEASGGLWPYRHVGLVIFNPAWGIYAGYAADIPGNGAVTNNAFPGGNLYMFFGGNWPPAQITVWDPSAPGWNQTWNRADSYVNYTPLPEPSNCGSYFAQFEVYSNGDNQQAPAPGFACVLRTPTGPRAWVGFGTWAGMPYSDLGIAHIAPEAQYPGSGSTSGGPGTASYFCRPNELCQPLTGTIWFKPFLDWGVYDGYNLTSPLVESWRRTQ